MEIDATKGKQELYVKPTESLLAYSGNITKAELLERIKKAQEDNKRQIAENKKKKKEDKNGLNLM